jgi:serine/threonine protein kinase
MVENPTYKGKEHSYNRIDLIGEGGQAKAYLVERTSDKAQFIAKVSLNKAAIPDLMEEAERLSKFKDNHIVKMIECFEIKKGYKSKFVIILEYCNIGDLTKVFEVTLGKPEYLSLCLRLMNGILKGLNFLHD